MSMDRVKMKVINITECYNMLLNVERWVQRKDK